MVYQICMPRLEIANFTYEANNLWGFVIVNQTVLLIIQPMNNNKTGMTEAMPDAINHHRRINYLQGFQLNIPNLDSDLSTTACHLYFHLRKNKDNL